MNRRKITDGLMSHHVCFAMDEPWRELEMRAALERATGRKDVVKRFIGYWEGEYEFSFICDARAFEKIVKPSGFTARQECIMHIIGEEQRVLFHWQQQDYLHMDFMGYLRHVGEDTALSRQQEGWTYDPATHTYYIIVRPN